MSLEEIAKEYIRSEITCVVLEDRIDNTFTNIFSVAEMCPEEQPRSLDIGEGKSLQIDETRWLHIRRISYEDPLSAIKFYRSREVFWGEEKYIKLKSECSKLVEEPENEAPIVLSSSASQQSSVAAVLPKRKVSMRVCAQVDLEEATRGIFRDEEFSKVIRFIEDQLQIDLMKYSEFLGSVFLCFANPYIRNIQEYLAKQGDYILVEIREIYGKTIRGGKIEIADCRVGGQGFVIRKEIIEPYMAIPIPCIPQKLKTRIFDKYENLIEERDGNFVQSLEIGIGVMGPIRKIIRNVKNPKENSEIQTVSYEGMRSNSKQTIQSKLSQQDRVRERESLEERREFVYFEGGRSASKHKAQGIVRELLGRVRERCYICDPYLSAGDIIDYALYVSNSTITVKLISSEHFLRSGKDEKGKWTKQGKIEGKKLQDMIKNVEQQDKTIKMECRVLLNSKSANTSPLHDRFIVIDDEVYLLGSSLNQFGKRATTLVRCPNPDVLIRQAEVWWGKEKHTISLDKWIIRGK